MAKGMKPKATAADKFRCVRCGKLRFHRAGTWGGASTCKRCAEME